MISKKMQKVCLLTLVLVFACCFFVLDKADAQKAIPFKFGFVSNAKLQGGQYGALVEKYVNEACKGRIEAKFFPSALLGTDPEMMDKTKIGLIQGMVSPLNVFGNAVPYVDVLMLPFLSNSWDKVFKFVNSKAGDEFLKGVEKYGYKGFGYSGYGLSGLETTSKASTLEQFQKMKFRVPESPVLKRTFEALKITPMVIQFPDLYEALKQGVVDGADMPPDVTVFVKFTEVIKFFVPTNHNFGWYMFITNKAWFDKLPEDLKGPFTQAIKRASKESLENSHKAELAAYEVFKQKGIQVVNLSQAELDKMMKMTKPVYDWRVKSYDDYGKKMAKMVFEQMGYKYDWGK